MTGTLGANAVWDWMPFMAGLNGEDGPHAHGNPVHGVERHMELKASFNMVSYRWGFKSLQALNPGAGMQDDNNILYCSS